MNLNKHIDFFNPGNVKAPIHIIGVGALGSRIAEILVRLGLTNIHIWDFDTVDAHNITNQLYFHPQIGMKKTEALIEILSLINPEVEKTIKTHDKYEEQPLSGYVFLAVDNIDLRRTIVKNNMNNNNIQAMFDCRMRLTDAQSYGADWTKPEQREALLNTMQFTSEEAKAATPVSACGTTLSVTPTVVTVASCTVSNFINLCNKKDIKTIILLDAFEYNLNAF